MSEVKLANAIIDYALEKMESADFTELKYTLRAAKSVLAVLPYYDIEKVVCALLGGEADAE